MMPVSSDDAGSSVNWTRALVGAARLDVSWLFAFVADTF